MGNQSSNALQPNINANSRETILKDLKCDVPYNYFGSRELINITYSPAQIFALLAAVQSKHDPSTMVNMLINCSDMVNDRNNVLEAIISAKGNRDESIIAYLNSNFNQYLRLYEVRSVIHMLFKTFGNTKYSPYSFFSTKTGLKQPDFSEIHSAFQTAIGCLMTKREYSDNTFKNTYKFFKHAISPSSLMAPIRDFSLRGEGTQITIEGSVVYPHSICSNGNYLFIHVLGLLYAIPITISGALEKPIVRMLRYVFLPTVSMVATKSTVIFNNGLQTIKIQIDNIIKGDPTQELYFTSEKSNNPATDVILGDGITSFRITQQFLCKDVKTNDFTLPNFTLQKGYAQPNRMINHILPQEGNYGKYPMYTNGHFVGIIYNIGERTQMVNRVFSMHDGKHVIDDNFSCFETVLAITYDAYHHALYAVLPSNNNRLVVRRMHFIGSEDPGLLDLIDYKMGLEIKHRAVKKFAQAICVPFSTLAGSQMFPMNLIPMKNPLEIIEFVETLSHYFLFYYSGEYSSSRDAIVAIMQSMVIILNANLILIRSQAKESFKEEMAQKIIHLVPRIPNNLACLLFFSNFDFFMTYQPKESTILLVSLFQNITWDPLINFVIRKLETSMTLSMVPFASTNAFTELIPNDPSPISKTPKQIVRLLFVHQHVMVLNMVNILKKNPLSEIKFSAQASKQKQTAINNFGDYIQIIISKFVTAVSKCGTPELLQDTLIFTIFDNFIRVISPLIEFHSIARVTTALMSVLLTKIADFISKCGKDLGLYPNIQAMILALLFAYGKFASTLVKGGGLSEFETKSMWLIRANINLVDDQETMDKLASDKIDGIRDPRLLAFISGENSAPIDFIYKKHKPPFHKNLSPILKELDRIVMLAIVKHTNLVDEFLECNTKPTLSAQLKKAADAMIKIRNNFRSLTQNEKNAQAADIRTRALMLCRMNSEFIAGENKESLITDFITSKFSPAHVTTIISQQRTRVQTTLVGFALIDQTYQQQIHPLLNDIIAYTMSCIKSFEGLAVILRITKLTNQQMDQIMKFFNRILEMLQRTHNERFAEMAFRFFRDVDSVPEIHNKFFNGVVNIIINDVRFYPAFALGLSLVREVKQIPEQILRQDATYLEITLLAELFKNIKADDNMLNMIAKRFFVLQDHLSRRIYGRVITVILNNDLHEETAKYFFNTSIKAIGSYFLNNQYLDIASEIITILRTVIHNNYRTKNFLISVIKEAQTDEELTGALSVLTNYNEPITQYCTARYHADRTTSTEVIVVPNPQQNNTYIFKKPFTIDEEVKIVKIEPPAFIYAVPRVTIAPRSFGNYEFILGLFDKVYKKCPMVTRAIYVQVLAHFLKDADFAKLITPEQFQYLSMTPTSFCNIVDTIKMINIFYNKKDEPAVGIFNQLRFKESKVVSLLSPQIRPNKKFTITVKTTKPRFIGHMGITSDTTEGFCTRYSLCEIPQGTAYPTAKKMPAIPPSNTFTMVVDVPNKVFMVGDNEYKFPMGGAFRAIIAFNESIPITIETDEKNFDPDGITPVQEHGALDFGYNGKLYNDPDWIKNLKTIPDLDNLQKTLPPLNLDTITLSYEERACRNFVMPVGLILIHPHFATSASKKICMELARGLFCHLSCQWATIALTRLAPYRPELFDKEKTVVRLFSILCVQLEQFLPNEFQTGRYPFAMGDPIWNERAATNLLYLGLDTDSKNAMCSLSTFPHIATAIGKAVKSMSMDPALHLCAYPNRQHTYYMPGKAPNPINTKGPVIAAVNNFTGYVRDFFKVGEAQVSNPGILRIPCQILLQINPKAYALSIFNISPMDNSWIFETPFEMLTLLKAFVAMTRSNEDRIIAKTVLIDSLLVASPIILPYLPQWLEQMQVSVPTTPLDKDTPYLKKLGMLGSFITSKTNNLRPDLIERLEMLYSHERRVLMSKMAAALAPHFPMFFNSNIGEPTEKFCNIPDAVVDPGAISEGFKEHILMLRLFARKYSTLVGFPFWEILPLWCRVAGFNKGEKDMIPPNLQFMNASVLRLTNPSSLNVTITFTPKIRLTPDVLIMQAKNESFEEPTMLAGTTITRPINTKEKLLFWSLIGVQQGWGGTIEVKMQVLDPIKKRSKNEVVKINIPEIRDKFIEDMKQFALEWDDEHTDALLNVLPRSTLQMPEFSTVNSVAVQSALSTQFSTSVLSLRALLIHHFNYIKMGHMKEIPAPVWNSLSKFVSFEDASDDFIRAVKKSNNNDFAEITIDRHAAHRLIMANEGDPADCIIHQIATQIDRFGPDRFRCLQRPWKVHFFGEEAIDAGGPARELMTEAAASIFEPTSKLTYNTPNGRHKTGLMRDLYVPYGDASRAKDFRAIGTYIGIVIRTGLMQELPFAPFVWKALAGSEITLTDILSVDLALAEQLSTMRQGEKDGTLPTFSWTVEQWDGTVVPLPGHSTDDVVGHGDVEAFASEAINFRINSLTIPLAAMREGFVENIGIDHHALMTGGRLSHMAQGSGLITVPQLKAITVVIDYKGLDDIYIQRFFRAVERFNADQRRLLLKFVTTLTRLPNSTINPNFVFKIDKLQKDHPDTLLPEASTCFNRLHLPMYSSDEICYQKLLTAVQYCQTMENR